MSAQGPANLRPAEKLTQMLGDCETKVVSARAKYHIRWDTQGPFLLSEMDQRLDQAASLLRLKTYLNQQLARMVGVRGFELPAEPVYTGVSGDVREKKRHRIDTA